MVTTVSARARRTHRVYLIRPIGDFSPSNWRQKPARFTIVRRLEITDRIGRADSLRWLQNQSALESGSLSEWAVVLPSQRPKSGHYCPACLASA